MICGECAALSMSDVPRPAWIYDAEAGRVHDANALAVRIYGHRKAEISRLRLGDLETGPKAAKAACPVQPCLQFYELLMYS